MMKARMIGMAGLLAATALAAKCEPPDEGLPAKPDPGAGIMDYGRALSNATEFGEFAYPHAEAIYAEQDENGRWKMKTKELEASEQARVLCTMITGELELRLKALYQETGCQDAAKELFDELEREQQPASYAYQANRQVTLNPDGTADVGMAVPEGATAMRSLLRKTGSPPQIRVIPTEFGRKVRAGDEEAVQELDRNPDYWGRNTADEVDVPPDKKTRRASGDPRRHRPTGMPVAGARAIDFTRSPSSMPAFA